MSKTVEISDLSDSLDREPTAIHRQFSDWLIDKTGYDPTEHDPEEAWMQAIKLGALHRGDFQRSPENRASREERVAQRKADAENRRIAAEERRNSKASREEERAAARQEREEKKAAKAAAAEQRRAEKAAKADDADDSDVSAKGSTPTKAKKASGSRKAAPEDLPEAAGEGEVAENNVAPLRKSRKTSGARKKSQSAPSPF